MMMRKYAGVQEMLDDMSPEFGKEFREKQSFVSLEPIVWIDASKELPDAGMEVLVCFERNDREDRDTCWAEYDDSLSEEGESPWMVDGDLTHFGIVLFWAEKPVGPQRS
jgi:hypothetical protein